LVQRSSPQRLRTVSHLLFQVVDVTATKARATYALGQHLSSHTTRGNHHDDAARDDGRGGAVRYVCCAYSPAPLGCRSRRRPAAEAAWHRSSAERYTELRSARRGRQRRRREIDRRSSRPTVRPNPICALDHPGRYGATLWRQPARLILRSMP
jgi:hypothetical protein